MTELKTRTLFISHAWKRDKSYWKIVGRAALDNPELPVSFVAEALASMREPRDQATPFVPRTRKA